MCRVKEGRTGWRKIAKMKSKGKKADDNGRTKTGRGRTEGKSENHFEKRTGDWKEERGALLRKEKKEGEGYKRTMRGEGIVNL